jgi:hypothetical protein
MRLRFRGPVLPVGIRPALVFSLLLLIVVILALQGWGRWGTFGSDYLGSKPNAEALVISKKQDRGRDS